MITQHEKLDIAIQKVGNRYVATMLIAKRIRQLNHGARPRVERQEDENNFSVAVREIAEGHISIDPQTASPASKNAGAANSNGAAGETAPSSGPTTRA